MSGLGELDTGSRDAPGAGSAATGPCRQHGQHAGTPAWKMPLTPQHPSCTFTYTLRLCETAPNPTFATRREGPGGSGTVTGAPSALPAGQPDRPSPAAGHRSSDQPRQAAGPPAPVRGAGLAWKLHTGTAGPGQAGGHYLSDGVSEEQDAGPAQEPPADSRLRQRHGRGRTSAGSGGLAASSAAGNGADRWKAPVTNRVQIPAPLNLLSPL